MTKYSTTNIKSKGNMLIKEDCRSPPDAAAGAVWAKADEMNIDDDCMMCKAHLVHVAEWLRRKS